MIEEFLFGLSLGIILTLRLFPDPYHRQRNVNFWTWAYREIDELIYGEKG